jgi:hypothetical protein
MYSMNYLKKPASPDLTLEVAHTIASSGEGRSKIKKQRYWRK